MLGESKNKFVTVRNSRFQRVVVQHWGVRFNPERIFFFLEKGLFLLVLFFFNPLV